jgi:hypothetical protein
VKYGVAHARPTSPASSAFRPKIAHSLIVLWDGMFHRLITGVMNFSNDPSGVQSCYTYGDCYLLLQNVRLRATFASGDTSDETAQMATCEYYAHVLNTYTDVELKDIHSVASGAVQYLPSTSHSSFKEVQLHGPLKLSRVGTCGYSAKGRVPSAKC